MMKNLEKVNLNYNYTDLNSTVKSASITAYVIAKGGIYGLLWTNGSDRQDIAPSFVAAKQIRPGVWADLDGDNGYGIGWYPMLDHSNLQTFKKVLLNLKKAPLKSPLVLKTRGLKTPLTKDTNLG